MFVAVEISELVRLVI